MKNVKSNIEGIILPVILTVISVIGNLHAQEIFYADSTFGIFTPLVAFGTVNIAQCQDNTIEEELVVREAFDILVFPDDRIFGYGVQQGFLDTAFFQNFYPPNAAGFHDAAISVDQTKKGATCDENGYTYTVGKGITKMFPEFGSYQELYLGDLPPDMQCEGGLTYRRGKFYLHSINNQLVEVNMKDPSQSRVVMDFPPGTLPIDALATVQVGCDSVVTYAVGRTPNNSKIYEVNFSDWTLAELCDLPISIVGAGSQTECMLPPCNIFLDLDGDNSSFAFRGDFCADTFCVPPVAVADDDVAILSVSGTVESVTLELVGWLDAGQEYLSAGMANNINVIGNNTAVLTLENNGNAGLVDFENAISAVMYHNDAPMATNGVRRVLATAFAGGETSLVSIAALPLSNEQIVTGATVTDPTCHSSPTGSVSVISEGGVAPYTYLWGIGQTGPSVDGLTAGSYPFLIVDAIGCTRLDTAILENPDSLASEILYSGPPAICGASGELAAVASGGSGTLSYVWSNGISGSLNPNVGAGSYTLTVQDTNGCVSMDSIEIPMGDTVLVLQGETLCQGEVFTWHGTSYSTDTSVCQVFTMANGCDSTICLSLSVDPLPTVSILVDGNFCDQSDITLSAGAHESYVWSTNETTPEIVTDTPGFYSVTVTNVYGCSASTAVSVSPALAFDIFSAPPSCFGDTDGMISVGNVIGGMPPFLYSIDGGNQFSDSGLFENLPHGSYLVVVEGADGCREEMNIIFEPPSPVIIDAVSDQTINLGEGIALSAVTNIEALSVTWQPPDFLDCAVCLTTNAVPLKTVQYTVEVVDSNGCAATDVVNITVNDGLDIYAPSAFSPNGDGINDFFTIHTGRSVAQVLSLRVYDRWGGLMFETKNPPVNMVGEGWDGFTNGKPAPIGVYVFISELLKVDGRVEVVSGEVNLLR